MTYGGWAQWRRRVRRSGVVRYVTCPDHQRVATCGCMLGEVTRRWEAQHGGRMEVVETGKAGQHAAGLLKLP